MDNNYHIFVVITTIIVYIFLSSKKKESNDETSTNIMYLLYIPVILYGGYYIFYSNPTKPENLGSSVSSDVSVKEISLAPISQTYVPSDNLLSDPYPSSTNSNF